MPTDLRLFFRLAFGITWGTGALALLIHPAGLEPGRPLYYLAGFGPSLAGILVTYRRGGASTLRALARKLLPARSSLVYYVMVAVGLLAIAGTARRFMSDAPALAMSATLRGLGSTLLMDTGPVGEEFGWRGVALPLLLTIVSPKRAAIMLGLVWFAWHLPTFFVATLPQRDLSPLAFAINTVSLSILLTWLWLRTSGDLLLMIWTHAFANLAMTLLQPPLWGMAAGTAVVALGLWSRLPRAARSP